MMGRLRARVANLWDRARTLAELGWLLFLRDFRIRFRQTFLGSLWAVAQVLMSYLPLVFVGSQLGLAGDRDPRRYALHSLLGLLIWQMFWDGLFSPQWIGRRMRGLLAEAAFPTESILVAGASYAVYNAAIYLVVILAAFPMLRIMPPSSLILGVLAMPLVIMAGVAVGLWVVPFTFVYLDFRYALPMLSPALMWTAPILYDQPASGALHWANRLNPLTYLVDAPRDWFASGWQTEEMAFPIAVLVSIALLITGLRFYRSAMPRVIECVSKR